MACYKQNRTFGRNSFFNKFSYQICLLQNIAFRSVRNAMCVKFCEDHAVKRLHSASPGGTVSLIIRQILAYYELFRMVLDIPGAIVECGVFKGASLARFAMFRNFFGNPFSKKIIAFDTFGEFSETNLEADKDFREFL